jgi:hypothetical protein
LEAFSFFLHINDSFILAVVVGKVIFGTGIRGARATRDGARRLGATWRWVSSNTFCAVSIALGRRSHSISDPDSHVHPDGVPKAESFIIQFVVSLLWSHN